MKKKTITFEGYSKLAFQMIINAYRGIIALV